MTLYKSELDQEKINQLCLYHWDKIIKECEKERPINTKKRLRTCNAYVYETEHYYILQSYTTLVAAIDKDLNLVFDMLRYTYEYTNTSAQHIIKFIKDYAIKDSSPFLYRWRKI